MTTVAKCSEVSNNTISMKYIFLGENESIFVLNGDYMIYKNNYDNHAIIMLLFLGHSKQGWKCKFCKLNFHNGCKNKVNYT